VAYYRFERIVEDLAVFAEQLLLSDEGGDDRAQSVRYVKSNFQPGGTIERAYAVAREAMTGGG
jgi:spectinomycin phosphotransferase